MITPPAGVRAYLACGYTDMRNHAATMIMQSRRRWQAEYRSVPECQLRITDGYPEVSIAISLSRGRNLPGLISSGARTPSISSFSSGSPGVRSLPEIVPILQQRPAFN